MVVVFCVVYIVAGAAFHHVLGNHPCAASSSSSASAASAAAYVISLCDLEARRRAARAQLWFALRAQSLRACGSRDSRQALHAALCALC